MEITLALGIVSFAFVALFGLLPTGLSTFRQSIETSVSAQIAHRIINEMQQTDFDLVVESNTTAFRKATRFFDDRGSELPAAEAANAIYQANIRIVPATTLSATTSANTYLATGTVQIARNPGNRTLTPDATTYLWKSSPSMPVLTYTSMVARNK